MTQGRPLKYQTPEEMQEAIDIYFESVDVPTITGLALALGFDSRQTLLNYKERDGFLDTIKAARLKIEAGYERELVTRNGSVTGLIFNLKNNFAWKDAQEYTHLTEDDEGKRSGIKFV
jgi:hypothetical protein